MLSGAIGFGGENAPMLGAVSAHLDRVHVVSNSEHSIVFGECKASIERQAPNSFIYCMSAVRRVPHADGIFPDYDSSWAITRSKANDLAAGLARSLRKTLLSLEQDGKSALPEGVAVGDLQIGCRHELVNYVPRDLHIQVHGAVSVDDFMQSIRDMSFVKPPSYANELEYRFSYTLIREGFVIQPTVKNIILSAEEIIDLLV